MNVVDIIILVIAALAVFKGLKDGLVRQVGGIAGLFIGIYMAYKFSSLLAGWLAQWISASEPVVKSISFVLIIIAVCILMNLLGRILEKILSVSMLGWLNRLLGVILSVATAALLMGVILSLLHYVNQTWFVIVPEKTLSESRLLPVVENMMEVVMPYLKAFFKP